MMNSKIEVDWKAPGFVKAFQSDANLKILNNFIDEQLKDLFAIANRQFLTSFLSCIKHAPKLPL